MSYLYLRRLNHSFWPFVEQQQQQQRITLIHNNGGWNKKMHTLKTIQTIECECALHACVYVEIEWGEIRYGIKESPQTHTKKQQQQQQQPPIYVNRSELCMCLCTAAKLSVQRLEGERCHSIHCSALLCSSLLLHNHLYCTTRYVKHRDIKCTR